MFYLLFIALSLIVGFIAFYQWQYFMIFAPIYYRKEPLCSSCTLIESVMEDGVVLEGALYEPPNPKATLLVFVGRSHDAVGLLNSLVKCYSDVRIVTWNYRGYGKSGGSADEAVLYSDALAVAEIVARNYGAFHVLGFSLGTTLAAYVASKMAVEKLFLIGAFDSIEALARKRYPWLPKRFLRYRFATIDFIGDVSAPTALFVSKDDTITFIENARKLKSAIRNLILYKEFSNISHKDLLFEPEVQQSIRRLLG